MSGLVRIAGVVAKKKKGEKKGHLEEKINRKEERLFGEMRRTGQIKERSHGELCLKTRGG